MSPKNNQRDIETDTIKVVDGTKVKTDMRVIGLLIAMAFGGGVWCTKISSDLEYLKKDVAEIKAEIHKDSGKVAKHP